MSPTNLLTLTCLLLAQANLLANTEALNRLSPASTLVSSELPAHEPTLPNNLQGRLLPSNRLSLKDTPTATALLSMDIHTVSLHALRLPKQQTLPLLAAANSEPLPSLRRSGLQDNQPLLPKQLALSSNLAAKNLVLDRLQPSGVGLG